MTSYTGLPSKELPIIEVEVITSKKMATHVLLPVHVHPESLYTPKRPSQRKSVAKCDEAASTTLTFKLLEESVNEMT